MKPPTLETLVCQNMEVSAAAVLLPHVILWDPIAQFPMFFSTKLYVQHLVALRSFHSVAGTLAVLLATVHDFSMIWNT